MPKITQLLSTGVIGSLGGAGAIWTTLENGGNPIAPWPICSALIGGLGALAAWRTLRDPKLDPEQIDRIDSNTQKGQEAAAEAVRAARAEGAKGREEIRGDGDKTREEIASLNAKIDLLIAQTTKAGEAPDAERTETRQSAAGRIVRDEPEAAEDIAEGRVTQGFEELEASALAKQAAAAQEWRDIGALAYDVEPERALRAYRKATQLDGSDFWAWVYLARLEQSHAGNLVAARIAAKAGLDAASEEREKSVAFNTIGDIAVAEGNLADARDAYTKGMEIAQTLSDADQNSASAKRDLSVSLNKLGDTAAAKGNLSDARDAYTKSMEIAQTLSDADQNSATAKRDLAISFERMGNLSVQEGNLGDARSWFEKEVIISEARVQDDPTNAEAKRFHSVVLTKLGDIAMAEGSLTEARDAYTKSMEISQALSDADPISAEAKRDVIVSFAKLAQVTGDVTYWQQALPVVEAMSAAGQLSPAD